MRKYISMTLKLSIFLCSTIGVILAFINANKMELSPLFPLLYFTNLSNIWIGLISIIMFVVDVISLVKKKEIVYKWMEIVKYIFTVTITITGVVFCVVLVPNYTEGYNPWNSESICVHVLVPLFSVIDFFVHSYKSKLSYKHLPLPLIPMFAYLFYAIIGYFVPFDYGFGARYPYFFLNWDSPLGAFKIDFSVIPYMFGYVYWILLILIFVLALSTLYIVLNKLINKKTSA